MTMAQLVALGEVELQSRKGEAPPQTGGAEDWAMLGSLPLRG